MGAILPHLITVNTWETIRVDGPGGLFTLRGSHRPRGHYCLEEIEMNKRATAGVKNRTKYNWWRSKEGKKWREEKAVQWDERRIASQLNKWI